MSEAERAAEPLATELDRLLACVHCGFCLDVCPTYVRLGDQADSPRGRLDLMRAVAEGRLPAGDAAFRTHIDRCLGCRACEPVCPSGVQYGFLLERARAASVRARGLSLIERLVLGSVAGRWRRAAMTGARLLRHSGLPALLARVLPGHGRVRQALGMLAATAPSVALRRGRPRRIEPTAHAPSRRGEPVRVAVLKGCVQRGLYGHVNAATRRVLRANGCRIVAAPGQRCCGALHAHGGDLVGARRLARANLRAFMASGADRIVANAAGCGAFLKEYEALFERDPNLARPAAELSARVRDVHEALLEAGPRTGAPMAMRVAYDAPCHLVHAQRAGAAPLAVLATIPGLEVVPVSNADECCGGAGTYGLENPELGGRILADKLAAVRAVGADVVATPNAGCMMQIGAGLRMAGDGLPVLHPIELLDESYRRAGVYAREGA